MIKNARVVGKLVLFFSGNHSLDRPGCLFFHRQRYHHGGLLTSGHTAGIDEARNSGSMKIRKVELSEKRLFLAQIFGDSLSPELEVLLTIREQNTQGIT